MVFAFASVYVMDYVYRFVDNFEPAFHPRDKADLIVIGKLLDVLFDSVWIWFASILLRFFSSMFTIDTGLKFSLSVVSLLGFGIRMMLAS